jgi:hypothetical protein
MALVHKTKKVTHCLAATKQYMQRFFSTLTHMYETGLQTDLVLVASDGTPFSIHKVNFKHFSFREVAGTPNGARTFRQFVIFPVLKVWGLSRR